MLKCTSEWHQGHLLTACNDQKENLQLKKNKLTHNPKYPPWSGNEYSPKLLEVPRKIHISFYKSTPSLLVINSTCIMEAMAVQNTDRLFSVTK